VLPPSTVSTRPVVLLAKARATKACATSLAFTSRPSSAVLRCIAQRLHSIHEPIPELVGNVIFPAVEQMKASGLISKSLFRFFLVVNPEIDASNCPRISHHEVRIKLKLVRNHVCIRRSLKA